MGVVSCRIGKMQFRSGSGYFRKKGLGQVGVGRIRSWKLKDIKFHNDSMN